MTTPERGWTAVVLPLVLTLACTFAVPLVGQPFGALLVVLVVYLWRRWARRPWAGLGLGLTWSALPLFLVGVGVTVTVLVGANAVSVVLGAARWVPWVPDDLAFLPVAIAVIVLVQALPEELLWRGNLHDMLAERMSTGAVVAVTSVLFGAVHVFSQSQAQGAWEMALYAVGAMALGLVCAVSRARTGTLWMAVGVHSGFYFAHGFFPTEGIVYGVQLLVQILAMGLFGLVVLVMPRRGAA
ncbi:CPBP family intramembrane glutamic endopeptidase [Nocardiopsis deserti]|uniref:CPBP family intramembrane glutamic endopeptidase n=1 Tax=Nocardiopsis deserti TaxID=2605988 RepID=UPI00123AE96D|nr:CPBP family intramembrane glutamic endopeptidase [Nocardiopsis deserti]